MDSKRSKKEDWFLADEKEIRKIEKKIKEKKADWLGSWLGKWRKEGDFWTKPEKDDWF